MRLTLFLVAAAILLNHACAHEPPVLHRVVVVKPEGSDSSGVLDRCREFCSHNFQTWRKHRGPECESAVVTQEGSEEFICRAGDA